MYTQVKDDKCNILHLCMAKGKRIPSERRLLHSVQALEKNSLFKAFSDRLKTDKNLLQAYITGHKSAYC